MESRPVRRAVAFHTASITMALLTVNICTLPPVKTQSRRQMSRGQDRRTRPRRARSGLPRRFGEPGRV
jgi:hypothetical protein